jgi:hypothetical protein
MNIGGGEMSSASRSSASACLLASTAFVLWTAQAAAQSGGYVVLAGAYDGAPPSHSPETTSAILPAAPEFPSIEALPDAGAENAVTLGEEQPQPAAPAERRVRVVGPRFLPDPEEALDLRAPARTPAP